jgi:hypothetical protein
VDLEKRKELRFKVSLFSQGWLQPIPNVPFPLSKRKKNRSPYNRWRHKKSDPPKNVNTSPHPKRKRLNVIQKTPEKKGKKRFCSDERKALIPIEYRKDNHPELLK